MTTLGVVLAVVALGCATGDVPPVAPHAGPSGRMSGEALFALVRTYSALGNHRVGTDVDRRTIAWFAGALRAMGAEVTLEPFRFERFDATSTVTLDGEPLASLPLYYEGVGTLASDAPFVGAAKPMNHLSQTSPELDAVIARAKAAGARIAVVATEHPDGALQIPNRIPKPAEGLPVVLVPGAAAARLATARVHVDYRAQVVPGESRNVVARFGDATATPVVLATPLSG